MIKLFIILLITMEHMSAAELPHFPIFKNNDCGYKKDYVFLSKAEKDKFEHENNVLLSSSIIRKMQINCKGKISYAYILNDKIRTHYQTLLVWVENKMIKNVDVLEFSEPSKYKAPVRWYEKMRGLNENALLGVDALSGATLTRQSSLKLIKQALIFDTK